MKQIRLLVFFVLILTVGILMVCRHLTVEACQNGHENILVKGAKIHGANGVIFDNQDNLYIASWYGREILKMNPKTGIIIERISTDLGFGFEGPDDLIFGPDGSLYWTALSSGYVIRFQSDGTFIGGKNVKWGTNPITFSDDGRLFVALDFYGEGLYEIDPNIVGWNTSPEGDPDIEIAGYLNGMDFGPDGLLYGPLFFGEKVVRINVDTGMIEEVADGFGIPSAVKFNSKGRLHVTDAFTGEVLRINTDTGEKKVIAELNPGLDNLAFDSHDHLYVSSFQDGSIYRVCGRGSAKEVSQGGMIAPGGVAVLARNHGAKSVFVADTFSLREFNGKTGKPRSVERFFWFLSDIIDPKTVSPYGENLVLSNWDAVQVWDPKAKEVVNTYPNSHTPINAIQFQSDIVVAELSTGQVVRISDNCALAVGLAVPAGLAATDDDLWVGDWATGTVWQIVKDGELLVTPVQVATGLSYPEGLAVDLDGNLLVVETGTGCLSRIDIGTGEVTLVADGLALGLQGPYWMPPTWFFNGVAVGQHGAIYVTGDIDNVLYCFKPPSQDDDEDENHGKKRWRDDD